MFSKHISMVRTLPYLVGLLAALMLVPARAEPILTTFAGGGDVGDGGPATAASLHFPTGVALDRLGHVYFTDETTHRVRKVDRATNIITTIAGAGTSGFSGDGGPATQALMNLPIGLVVDRDFNIFVAEKANHRVRRIDGATGIITTVAGTGEGRYNGDGIPATQAMLQIPVEVTVDPAGNLYIVDQGNNRIRKVDAASGLISTVAGNGTAGFSGDNGPATAARLNNPAGIVVGTNGDMLIADKSNQRVRRVFAADGKIRTVAGTGAQGYKGDGGPALQANFDRPANVELAPNGDLLVVDEGNNRIRRIDRLTGIITSVVGDGKFEFNGDGIPANQAGIILPTGFSSPGLAISSTTGNMFFADRGNQRVRMVTAATGLISTFAGGGGTGNGGLATSAVMVVPSVVGFDIDGGVIICDRGNNQIRRVDAATGITTPYVGTGIAGFSGDGGPALDARLAMPLYIAFDRYYNLYISDQFNQVIRRVDAVTRIITTIAGTPGVAGFSGDGGLATGARLSFPMGLAFDSNDNLYIADQYNARIRRIDQQTGIISTVAGTGARGFSGDGGPATSAKLGLPIGVAFDSNGNLYIGDREHSTVRKIDNNGIISRYAGTVSPVFGGVAGYAGDGGPARAARLSLAHGINFDDADNLYIADFGNGAIRRVDAVTKIITTVAGTGVPGFSGDGGPATAGQLNLPMSVIVDPAGDLYIGDVPNNRIRKVFMNP